VFVIGHLVCLYPSKAGQGAQTEMSAKTGSDNTDIFLLYGTDIWLVYGQIRGRWYQE